MLELKVNYKDFNDNEVEESVYFHFSQDEMYRFLKKHRDAVQGKLAYAVHKSDTLEAYEFARELMVAAYGERSEDGRRFVKSEEVSKNLTETPLLDAVLEKVFASEQDAQNFVNAIIPPKMRETLDNHIEKEKKTSKK